MNYLPSREPLDFRVDRLACTQEPLRLAVITETYPPEVNGVALTLARVVEGLRAKGHSIELIRPKQPNYDLRRESDPDELLTAGMAIPNYPGLRMGLPSKRRLVRHWSLKRPDLVHIATEGPLGWSALQAALHLKLPISSDFRTNFHAYSGHYGAGWLSRTILAYLRKFHNKTLCTTVPTQELAEELSSLGFQRLKVVARGVDTKQFRPDFRSEVLRQQWGAAPEDPVALFVGRLAAEKNLDLVIRCFHAMRQHNKRARLVFVGDGPQRSALMQACPEAQFAGMIQGPELSKHYASADFFLFPSLTETFGNVTLEAMASGLPALAYRHAAAAALLEQGGGIAIPPGQEGLFIEHSVGLMADQDRRRLLGQQAREIAQSLDWEKIIDELELLMRQLVSGPPKTLCFAQS
jgi:glycosyltransferase involved in cell wall biosynthesis